MTSIKFFNKRPLKYLLSACATIGVVGSAAAQQQINVPPNQPSDPVTVASGDKVLSFMDTSSRYFCYISQEGALNLQVNSVQFDTNVESGGGVAADVRPLSLVPFFENNPEQFLNIKANEAGFQSIPIVVSSVNSNLPQTPSARIRCCSTTASVGYNTFSTPFNYLELNNNWGEGEITVKLEIFSNQNPPSLITAFSTKVPANGRIDLGIHDLLTWAGINTPQFGRARVTHDGPAGLLEAFLSRYDQFLGLRETLKIAFANCGLS